MPSRALALLLLIGFVDLVVTAVLHARGQIVELNPVMRPFIERSEWVFVLVKGSTLIGAWYVMMRYGREHRIFIRNACLFGCATYVFIWTGWFLHG